MKVSYTTNNQRLTVELEADSPKTLWAELAQFQEVFEYKGLFDRVEPYEITG